MTQPKAQPPRPAGVVRIPPALDARLTALAARTGRAKSYYARKALEAYLEEQEDELLLAQAIAERKRDPSSFRWEDIKAKYGLDD